MRMFNSLSKLVVITTLSFLSFNSKAQRIVMDSVSFPSPMVVCEQDTVSFFFRTGLDTTHTPAQPYSNIDVHIDLPDGFKFVRWIPTKENFDVIGGFFGNGVDSTTINSSNPNDIIIPYNGFLFNAFSTAFEVKIIVEPSCGAIPSKSLSYITDLGSTTVRSDTIETTTIHLDEPYVVFRGISNTTPSNANIDLSTLAIGQKYQRCFKVDYTSFVSSINEMTILVPNANRHFQFDWVSANIVKTIVNDTVYYTFGSSFFATVGDGDGFLEPGESFTFCDSVTVLGNCNSQNSNVTQNYILQWGCGGSLCQNITTAAEGVIALTPTQIETKSRRDLDVTPNLCDTCSQGLVKFGVQIKNISQPVLPTGGFATNLIFELGTSSSSNTPGFFMYQSSNFCFDSVTINGVRVPFTLRDSAFGASAIRISNLTSFSGYGLQDVDLDGSYDDLAVGDSLVFEIYGTSFARRYDTSDLPFNLSGGNSGAIGQTLVSQIKGVLDVTYHDECGGNKRQKRIKSHTSTSLRSGGSSSSIDYVDFFDGGQYRLDINYDYGINRWNLDCDSEITEFRIVVPKDVSLDTGYVGPGGIFSLSNSGLVAGYMEKDGVDDRDTIFIWYNSLNVKPSHVRLRYDCSGGVCPEADSLRKIEWFFSLKCYDDATGQECYETAMNRGTRLVRFHCDEPPQGASLRIFNMERTTFGYTDDTETTRVNRNTPGILLNNAMIADTVSVQLKGVVNSAVLDSLHARLSYHTAFGSAGTRPIFRADTEKSTITIYDASTSMYHTFKLNAPGMFPGEFAALQSGTSHNYDFQWNLSTYKDSIGGGYRFTGGSDSTQWDSILLDIKLIVEDNTGSGHFQIDPYAQIIEFADDTATQCDIYGGNFYINQRGIGFGIVPNLNTSPCNRTTNNIYVGTIYGDSYPNEFRKNQEVRTVRYSWDPTYFSDPDSVVLNYSGISKRVTYSRSGNSITIPLERSTNLHLLPESNHANFQVFQTPTCAMEDNIRANVLGIKGSADIVRYTNAPVTNTIIFYDTTQSGRTNINSTPFNITSLPVVAAASSDSVCWTVKYQNLSFTDIDYTWLDFATDSVSITSIVRIDSGLSIPQTMYSYGTNGLWINADTIKGFDFKSYKVCGQYSSCTIDSIVITGGWNCDTYPTDPASGYPPSAYSCEHNQQKVSVYVDELGSKLQLNMINESAMPIQLCDTLNYELKMSNIDLTDLRDLVFSSILPSTTNVSYVPGSTKLIWPYDGVNTTEQAIADPVAHGDSLAYSLLGYFDQSFLRNFEIPLDSSEALIKLSFTTNCMISNYDDIRFNVQGLRGCGQRSISRTIVSAPFEFLGLKPRTNRLVNINTRIDTIEACDTATRVDVSFFNMLTKPTKGSEVLAITFPNEFDMSGSIYNIHNGSFLDNVIPYSNTVTGGLRTIEWKVKQGMMTAGPTGYPGADSLAFSFSIVPITNVNCMMDTAIKSSVFERYILYCLTDSTVPCVITYPLDDESDDFIVTKGDITLSNVSTVLNGCNDSLSISFDYKNIGTKIPAGVNTNFKLLVDVNGNGLIDATDVPFDTIVHTTGISKGDSGTINYSVSATKYSAAEICNILVVIDSMSSCICDTNFIASNIVLDMELRDSSLCDNDTVDFAVCAGTGNYSSRTYTWYDIDGLGREIYLSDVNNVSPTFDPPVVTVNTTFRYGIRVNRGTCINEDTVSISVKIAPNPFNVVDDTICNGSCVTLTAASLQTGVVYNVYDGLGSFLGTLPYVTCPTSTSTYHFEAVDTAAGCGAVRDSAIITVVDKQSPGVSYTVSGCGVGCVFNLFDSLAGTPDTTGTWTDPSGASFGSGYNVTYNASTDIAGVYTYRIVNAPCNDTFATITIPQVTEIIAIVLPEDSIYTVCPPLLSNLGSIGTMNTTCGPNHGTVIFSITTGCMTYKPDTNYVGFDTVCVVTCDTNGICDSAIITITVTPVTDTTPIITKENTPFTLCPPATTDVDALGTVTLICGPSNGMTSIVSTTGCVTYKPDTNFVGKDTLCIVTCDVNGVCDTSVIFITVTPVIDTVPAIVLEDDTVTLCPPSITSVNNLASISLDCTPVHGTTSVNLATGCITYIPDTNYVGVDTMCVVVCDVSGVCDTTLVPITVVPVRDTITVYLKEDSAFSMCPPVITIVDAIDSIYNICGGNAGTLTFNQAAGCFTYQSNTNYVGYDTLCIVKCDVLGVCDTTTILIRTGPIHDTISRIILEDSIFTICPPVISNLGGNITSISSICGTAHGTLTTNVTTGCISYRADTNYVGVDTVCIVTCSDIGSCDTTVIGIFVVPVRDTITRNIDEDVPFTVCPPVTTDTDVLDTATLICGPKNGMVSVSSLGCVTYTPNLNFSGEDTLCVVTCDIKGVCDTTTILITINPVSDTIRDTIPEDSIVTLCPPVLSGVSPVDSIKAICGPSYGTVMFDTTTGCMTYKPDTNYIGNDTICVVTCDSTGKCDTTVVILSYTSVRDTVAMTLMEDGKDTICPPATTGVSSLGSANIVCGPKHGTRTVVDAAGCVIYIPDTNYVGVDTICIRTCNTAGLCDTTILVYTVVPVLDTITRTVDEDVPFTVCPPVTTDTDVLDTAIIICGPNNGTPVVSSLGCVTYTPNLNFSGNDTMCIKTCDINGVCDTTVVVITITPVADTIMVSVPEDSVITLCPPVLSGVSPIDSIKTVCGPSYGTVIFDTTTGCMTYNPDTNFVGCDTICVVTCSPSGVCDTTIVIVCYSPVIDTISITLMEDGKDTICPPATTGVSSLGSANIVCGPKHGTRTVVDAAGCVIYIPDTNYVGVDTICIRTCNTAGLCDTTILVYTVVPVLDTITRTVDEDVPFTVCPPVTTDTDVLDTAIIICGPNNGTPVVSSLGCVTYTPNLNFSGNDTMCIKTCDINGVCDTTVVVITITPVADTIMVSVPEDSVITLCPPVLSGVSPIDSIKTICGPSYGTVILDPITGCMTYKPDTNFVGCDTICVVTCNPSGVCDTTVVITCFTPVIDTVTITLMEDGSDTICPPATSNVAALGTVQMICGTNHGSRSSIDAAGCVIYVPDTNYVGLDTVCVRTCDPSGLCDTTILVYNVVPVRDTIFRTMPADSAYTFCPPVTTDTDILDTATIICGPSLGTISVNSLGCVTYTGDSTKAGIDTVCIVTCDVNGVCDTTTIIMTLNRVFIPFNVADDSICEGDCVTLMADTMQAGVIYRIHSPVGTIIGRLPMVVCPTTDSIFYIEAFDSITAVTSIWDTATIFVTQFRSPGMNSIISICETGSVFNLFDSIAGAPDTTGTWDNPNGFPFGTRHPGTFNPLVDTFGVYTYTIVNPVCPDTSSTITVNFYSAPIPGENDTINLCQNGSLTDLFNNLLGTPDNTGNWAGPSPTTNGFLGTLDPLTANNGNYWYRVSKAGCADDSAHVRVFIDTIEDPSIHMSRTELCKGLETAQVNLLGATGGTFSINSVPTDNININSVTGVLTFSSRLPFETRAGIYEVYYTTAGPCPEVDTIEITISQYGDGCEIEIPQFISPNGDGKNDVFVIPGIDEFPNNMLKVYNRWGSLVYEKKEYDNSWDGKATVSKGVNPVLGGNDILPVGTYFYVFESGDERYPAFSGYVYIKR